MTNTEPRPAGGLSATVTRRVEWIDTDASGHHHNALVWRLAESAERALLAQAGVLEEYFWAAPRVHQEADFTATLHFDQEVTCTLTVEKLGRGVHHLRLRGVGRGSRRRTAAASGVRPDRGRARPLGGRTGGTLAAHHRGGPRPRPGTEPPTDPN